MVLRAPTCSGVSPGPAPRGTVMTAISATGQVTCAADAVDAGNAQTLDGLDSTSFARGHTFTAVSFVVPGTTTAALGAGTEPWSVTYACPVDPVAQLGTLTYETLRTDYRYTRLWSDNGTSDPAFVQLDRFGGTT